MSPHRDGNTLENPAEEYGVNELQDVPPSTANELHAADSDARSLPKRKKKKRPMFDESMTDADRRVIRRQQRQVGFELIQSTSIEDAQKARALNNSIFEKVVYTREAVLDAENVKSITQKLSHHAERQVQVPRYDVKKLISKLRSKCRIQAEGSIVFDWKSLGRESCMCFNSVPSSVRFLGGVLNNESSEVHMTRAKRSRDNGLKNVEEIQPEQVTTRTKDSDNLSAVEKAMKSMSKKLTQRIKEDHGGVVRDTDDIDGIQFLFNPESFTQTVENIFNYSFLVKDGKGAIFVRDQMEASQEGKPPGLRVGPRHNDSVNLQKHTQSVCSFTMSDWRKLCEAHNLEQGDLPTRKTKIRKTSQLSQPSSQQPY